MTRCTAKQHSAGPLTCAHRLSARHDVHRQDAEAIPDVVLIDASLVELEGQIAAKYGVPAAEHA